MAFQFKFYFIEAFNSRLGNSMGLLMNYYKLTFIEKLMFAISGQQQRIYFDSKINTLYTYMSINIFHKRVFTQKETIFYGARISIG